MLRLVIALFGLCCAAACADSRSPAPPLAYCPSLVDANGFEWHGVIGLPGAGEPGSCVAIYRGEARVAVGNVGPTGGFAMRFQGGGPRLSGSDASLELEIGGERFPLDVTGATEATIAYEPASLPLVERPLRTLLFTGELESTELATPITAVWMFKWKNGVVGIVPGPPRLDTSFVASISGEWDEEASLVSEHDSGGAGGCWWPRGGGGFAACPDEVRARTGCRVPTVPCMGRRGCEPIEVEERRSGASGPEQMRGIEVHDDRPGPSDAGPSDAEPT